MTLSEQYAEEIKRVEANVANFERGMVLDETQVIPLFAQRNILTDSILNAAKSESLTELGDKIKEILEFLLEIGILVNPNESKSEPNILEEFLKER